MNTKKSIFYHPSLVPIRAFVLYKSLEGRPIRLEHILYHSSHLPKDDFEKNKGKASSCLFEAENKLGENFIRITEVFYKLSRMIKYNVVSESFLQEVFFTEKHLEKVA